MNCSRTRGKKSDEHFDPLDPPRCRANKRRGRGTYANDRPPVLGVIGRESGQVRLRVVRRYPRTRPCVRLSSSLPSPMRWFTLTSIRVTTRSSASRNTFVMAFMNGRVMMTAMVGLKPIPIPKKACGRVCVISCVPFVVSISVICMSMLPFTSSGSISKRISPDFHRCSCPSVLFLNMSQVFCYYKPIRRRFSDVPTQLSA